jgi:hypothetical protein
MEGWNNKDGIMECWKNGMMKMEGWNIGRMEDWGKDKEFVFVEVIPLKLIIPSFVTV